MHKVTTTSAIALLLLVSALPAARADLRVPQVPVSGAALATFLTAQAQTINVATQQQDVQQFGGLNVGSPLQLTFRVHPMNGTTAELDAYNTFGPSSPLFVICPGSIAPGWYTEVAFRSNPNRMVVNIFDGNNVFQGTSTYLNADPFAMGLAVVTPGGTHFSQDARNAGGAAHLLFYRSTGGLTGSAWLGSEDQDGASSDFADGIFLLESFGAVPVERTGERSSDGSGDRALAIARVTRAAPLRATATLSAAASPTRH